MRKIPCTYIRGGTSRALFFKKEDLPWDQSLWPELFIQPSITFSGEFCP